MNRMLFVILLFALAVGRSATASADETATDMRGAILHCTPSCYEQQHFEGEAKKVKVCAYLPIHFVQEKRGKSWSKLERSSAMSPIAVPGCKFPTSVPGKWKAVVAAARKQLDLAKGDFVTVAADFGDWSIETDDFGHTTARTVMIDHYSRQHEGFDGCRAGNPFAVCEGENNEVTSFNRASYRVTEAKRLKQEGHQKECRIAAWEAVHQALETVDQRRHDGNNWTSKTYATRYDGVLNEKELFARNEALEAEGRRLWTSCGGKGEMPMD
jgi:hypothetical protein